MFHPDSWLIRFLARVCDLLFLNIALALANLPVTVLITTVNLLPLLIGLLFPALLGVVFAFWLLFGFAAGAWINSFYLNRIFESREDG